MVAPNSGQTSHLNTMRLNISLCSIFGPPLVLGAEASATLLLDRGSWICPRIEQWTIKCSVTCKYRSGCQILQAWMKQPITHVADREGSFQPFCAWWEMNLRTVISCWLSLSGDLQACFLSKRTVHERADSQYPPWDKNTHDQHYQPAPSPRVSKKLKQPCSMLALMATN